MRQRFGKVVILFSLVGLPVGVTLCSEQLDEWIGLPALAAMVSPAIALMALEQRHHQKA